MEPATDPAAHLSSLSQPELQVLRFAGEGKSTDQIAYLLSRNPAGVQRDRAAVYDKLGLTSLTPPARLQQLIRLRDQNDLDALSDRLAGNGAARMIEPSAAALAAVTADDRLLGQGGIPGPLVTEQRTTRIEPAPVVPGPRPFRPAWFNGGPGVMLAALAVAIVIGALLVWFFLAASRPAPTTQPVIVATVVAPSPPAQNVAPSPPPPPATPAPSPAASAPGSAVTSPPPAAAPAAPAAGSATVPAAAAPAAPLPSSAPVNIAPAAGGTAASPAAGVSGLPNLAPLPTATPFAMPPAGTTTPPGSVLTLGQTWSQDGINLMLASAQATAAGIAMNFVLSNGRSTPVTVHLTRAQIFSAVDNAGAPLTLTNSNYAYDFTLQPNTAVVFDAAHNGGPVLFTGNIGSPNVTAITVRVIGLSSLANARWQIALTH